MRRPVSYNGKYVYVWSKYRPVILKLMLAAADDEQEYKLSEHEFTDLNNQKKTGYSFSLRILQGRNENDIKKSQMAQDLHYMLMGSEKAMELTNSHLYVFELDKHFLLRIRREEAEIEVRSDEEE